MSDKIIRLDGLSKSYTISHLGRHGDGLRHRLEEAVRSPLKWLRSHSRQHSGGNEVFWALRDVSFEVAQGEVVGIIGRNGAGKSTLLKILGRITEPTSGSARIKGRVASLLEVGTGFHPELTGRENIFLNGAILGMTRSEIRRKFDEIVAFADVEKFLDTPVKRFSSGMYVRLAFAVAAHLEPDILLVDEVLAVGDAAFQKKCLGQMKDAARAGRTILFVTHNMAAIENLCTRGIVLQQGSVVLDGDVKKAASHYVRSGSRQMNAGGTHVVDLSRAPRASWCRPLLQEVQFLSRNEPFGGSLSIGEPLEVRIRFLLENPTSSFDVEFGVDNLLDQRIFTAHSIFDRDREPRVCVGELVFVCKIPSLALVPGEYKIKVAFHLGNVDADAVEDAARIQVVSGDYYGSGHVPWDGVCVMPQEWQLESGANQGAVAGEAGVLTAK